MRQKVFYKEYTVSFIFEKYFHFRRKSAAGRLYANPYMLTRKILKGGGDMKGDAHA